SPSECPARPRGWSSSTPPSTSGTPSARACASTPIPTRNSVIEPARNALEVGGRRHLEEPLVAGDDHDAAAGGLDERCAVRALARGGVAEGRGDEHLWSLDGRQLVAGGRLHDHPVAHALDGVRNGEDR